MQATWTAFRNGGGSGEASLKRLPLRWSPTQGIAWKTELPGYGQSSPVVWNGKVFVTAVQGPMRERCLVHSCELKSGKLLWSRSFASSLLHEMSYYVSRAAPTPVVDSKAIYAFFESGELVGLDHAGKPLWSRSLVKEYGTLTNEFGIGQSLAQNADTIFVLVDDPGVAYLLAVDKKTGKNRWKVAREPRKSWTSPVVTKQGEKEILIVSANGFVEGFDTKDGALLWSVDRITGNIMPSVSVDGDLVFVGATPAQARLARPGSRTAAESNCCIKLTTKDGKPGAEVLWEGKKATCDFASPLSYRGLVYYVTAAGIVFCVDAKTGNALYSERIDSPCWASPLAIGEHVYFFGKNGITTVIKAGPVFEKVVSNALWDTQNPPKTKEPFATTPNNPANAGAARASSPDSLDPILYGYAALEGQLVIRLGSHLFCLRV
ncbi:PQQ-binding-like beta-propeller repeat protein [Armatimonas sp.]|uniref:outer membrane protein assembly factor BamB family protein n=1 Tax=Armatimonas sp. TaxID=1872638 RepID=UPI00286CD60F|nr:PQQ-binding-like beta-propeller repeat protein [Armatimonas sp.]